MASLFIDPKVALKQSEYYVPKPNKVAEIDSFILSLIDGEMFQGDIADALLEKHPKRYKTFEDALEYVTFLSHRYSE